MMKNCVPFKSGLGVISVCLYKCDCYLVPFELLDVKNIATIKSMLGVTQGNCTIRQTTYEFLLHSTVTMALSCIVSQIMNVQ